jgi:hypothetical protein
VPSAATKDPPQPNVSAARQLPELHRYRNRLGPARRKRTFCRHARRLVRHPTPRPDSPGPLALRNSVTLRHNRWLRLLRKYPPICLSRWPAGTGSDRAQIRSLCAVPAGGDRGRLPHRRGGRDGRADAMAWCCGMFRRHRRVRRMVTAPAACRDAGWMLAVPLRQPRAAGRHATLVGQRVRAAARSRRPAAWPPPGPLAVLATQPRPGRTCPAWGGLLTRGQGELSVTS